MRHVVRLSGAAVLVLCVAMLMAASPATVPADARMRIGIYDNRAIVVAYAASSYNDAVLRQKLAERDAARKAGDTKKVQELEAWGNARQRMFHFQGFGHAPVGELLEPVKDKIAHLAAEQHLSAIAMECDYTADGVDVIDITDQLVALYAPTPRTLQTVKQLRAVKPIPLTQLADMPADQ